MMKNIIIFGAGKKGRILHRMIDYMGREIFGEQISVKFFCDNFLPRNSFIDGIKVIYPSQLSDLKEQYDIYISSIDIADDVMKQLFELSIKNNIYVVPENVYNLKKEFILPSLVKMDITKPRLPYLECAIVKHCNLNCSGCSAMANISEEEYLDIDEFEKDLKRLKQLYSGIKYFKLFGGEPLLHPMLKEFIKVSRLYFPDAEIVVHSNGLLIPQIEEDILKVMLMYNVKFVFTLYPFTGIKKRKIEERLSQADVEYTFGSPIYEFRKYININGNYDPKEMYENCCKCINLIDGTLSCGFGYGIERLEKKYDIQIYEKKFQNCINIYTTCLNGWEINEALDSPTELCAYCAFMDLNTSDDENYFPWKCGGDFSFKDWSIEK